MRRLRTLAATCAVLTCAVLPAAAQAQPVAGSLAGAACADAAEAATTTARAAEAERVAEGRVIEEAWRGVVARLNDASGCFQRHGERMPLRLRGYQLFALRLLDYHRERLAVLDTVVTQAEADGAANVLEWAYYDRARLLNRFNRQTEAVRDGSAAINAAAGLSPLDRARRHDLMASLLQNVGRLDAALEHVQEAQALFEQVPDEERGGYYYRRRTHLAHRHLNLVLAQHDEHMRPELDTVFLPLAAHLRQMADRSESATSQLMARRMIAEMYSNLGRHDRALRLNAGIVDSLRHLPNAEDDLLRSLHMYGVALIRAHDYPAAVQVLREGHELALQVGEPYYQYWTAHQIGYALDVAGHVEEAVPWYLRSREMAEVQRSVLGASTWTSAALDWMAYPHRALARLHLTQGRPAEALVLLEQARARTLRDLIQRARLRYDASPTLQRRADSLHTVLVEAQHAMLVHSPSDSTFLHHQQVALRIRAALEDAVPLAADPPLLDVAQLQDELRRDRRVLLTYFFDVPRSRPRGQRAAFGLLVTPDTVVSQRLALHPDTIDAHVERLLPGDGTLLTKMQMDLTEAHALYEVLVAPFASFLPAETRLLVVPEGPVHRLPFDMLVTAPTPRYAYRDAPYLLRRHAVSVEAAVSMPGHRATTDVAHPPSAFGVRRHAGRHGLADLPAAADEVERLADVFSDTRRYVDAEATEAALYADIGRSSILHLATHALVDEREPLRSTLLLSPSDTTTDGDGVVHAFELRRHYAPIPLVVLSACNTGTGRTLLGEGVEGLQHAFRALGAQSLLATLWTAEDAASADLTALFYEGVREGLPLDEALRQAKLTYLRDAPDDAVSPFFWAAPVLHGSAAPIERPSRPWLWWFAAAGACTLSVVAWRRRRSWIPPSGRPPPCGLPVALPCTHKSEVRDCCVCAVSHRLPPPEPPEAAQPPPGGGFWCSLGRRRNSSLEGSGPRQAGRRVEGDGAKQHRCSPISHRGAINTHVAPREPVFDLCVHGSPVARRHAPMRIRKPLHEAGPRKNLGAQITRWRLSSIMSEEAPSTVHPPPQRLLVSALRGCKRLRWAPDFAQAASS